jgi:glycosyltransferase involved in cell wall biosynthesis
MRFSALCEQLVLPMHDSSGGSALVISPEAPYPLAGGGALRTASLLEYLSRRYAVDLILFREPGAPDPGEALPPGLARRVYVIELPRHGRSFLARAGRNLGRLLRGAPPLNDRFSGFGREVSRLLERRHYDLAFIEHFWCAPYCEQVAPHARATILNLHNIESVFYGRCAGIERWPASAAFRRFCALCSDMERRWLPRFNLLLAASPHDARVVREIAPGCRCEVYPNAVPPGIQPQRPEEDVLIFSGNFEYRPNISAVRYFRLRIWPLLRERRPGLRWRLVGRNPDAVRREVAGDPRIELSGPVEDAVGALASARVVVVPLLAGSGTRLKILEAWAAGRAVVSTSLGAEGLPAQDGEHLLLADSPEQFAAAVSSLLDSPERRRMLGCAGRRLLEQKFTWPAAWVNLATIGI